jgi:predicted chitinase
MSMANCQVRMMGCGKATGLCQCCHEPATVAITDFLRWATLRLKQPFNRRAFPNHSLKKEHQKPMAIKKCCSKDSFTVLSDWSHSLGCPSGSKLSIFFGNSVWHTQT